MYPSAIDASLAARFSDDRSEFLGEAVYIVLAPAAHGSWHGADLARVPACWVEAVTRTDVEQVLALLGWTAVESIVPRTLGCLRDKLAGIGVLLSESEPPSLLYFFLFEQTVVAYEGFAPSAKLGAAHEPRPHELSAMQAVHDGWFDFFGGEDGWLPESEWRVIGRDRADGQVLIGVAAKGSALVGYEPGERGAPTRLLRPDDSQVETPGRLFEAIDRWIEAALEDALSQR